ncbi:MAG: hypothetical protein ACLPV4_12795 [Solirubrobacteraceae bacterium]
MAKTRIVLTTGKQFDVDDAIEKVKTTIDDSPGRWVGFIENGKRVEISSATVAYLCELPIADETASPSALMKPGPAETEF